MTRSICCALLLLTGCLRVNRNLSTTIPYKDMIGRVYVTQQDFTIFKYSDSRTIFIAEPGDSNRFFDAKILGTLPKDSVLEIADVREEGNFEMTFVYFYTTVLKSRETAWIGKVVSPMGMETLKEGDVFETKYLKSHSRTK